MNAFYNNFAAGEPAGRPGIHMNFDKYIDWDTKDWGNDKDNGFICKRHIDFKKTSLNIK